MLATAVALPEDAFVYEITDVHDEINFIVIVRRQVIGQHARPGSVKSAFVVLAGGKRYLDRRLCIGKGCSHGSTGFRPAAVFAQKAVIVGPGGFEIINKYTQRIIAGFVKRGLQHQIGKVRILCDL